MPAQIPRRAGDRTSGEIPKRRLNALPSNKGSKTGKYLI